MNTNRRQMLKGLSLGAGSMLLSPMIQRVMANAEGKERPPRFVFVLQSNGFDAVQACPESIPFQKYADREKFESIDLTQHKLPKGLAALEPLKSKTTIVQGLSGRCTGGGHSTWGGSLGQYRISGANLSPQNVTIDYQLGQAVPGILPWVGQLWANELPRLPKGVDPRTHNFQEQKKLPYQYITSIFHCIHWAYRTIGPDFKCQFFKIWAFTNSDLINRIVYFPDWCIYSIYREYTYG